MEYKGPSPDRKIHVMFASTFSTTICSKDFTQTIKKSISKGEGGGWAGVWCPGPGSAFRSMTLTLMTCNITGA